MNYGDLQSHFSNLLNRSDNTTALTQQFLQQGLTRIQRTLRTPMQEKTLYTTITQQTTMFRLPADFLETISLYLDEYELERVPNKRFRELNSSNYSGKSRYYTRIGPDILLYPQPTTGVLALYYYSELPPLVNPTDTHALSQVAADLIIYAALTYAADFYLDERADVFEQKYQQFFSELQEQSDAQETQGGTQSITPAYRYADNY
jgi:hypothetical protein